MKKLFLIMMVCLMTVTAFGQEKACDKQCNHPGKEFKGGKKAKEWMNQKKEQRRAFIIKKMELTEAEDAAFTAIYEDFDKKTSALKHKMNRVMAALNDTVEDEVFVKNLDIVDAQLLEQAKLNSEFYKAMKKILPIKKVYMYYKADKEFNKLMMKDIHPKRSDAMKKAEK